MKKCDFMLVLWLNINFPPPKKKIYGIIYRL